MAAGEDKFTLEYVTSLLLLSPDIVISINLTNDSDQPVDTRIVIYQSTKEGANVVSDTGIYPLTPTWTGGLGYGPQEPGNFWVRIQVASEFVIPQIMIERQPQPPDTLWVPYLLYTPGDFAVFRLQPERHRIW